MHNAWLRTIEDGVHTYDIHDPAVSTAKVGTSAFADAVIARLGSEPQTLKAARYADSPSIEVKVPDRPRQTKEQIGIDVFLDKPGVSPNELGAALEGLAGPEFRLDMLSNRGQKVYPDGVPETLCVDAYRCRFLSVGGPVTVAPVIGLLQRLADAGHSFIKSEGLFTFDGEPGFTKGQGQ
jgi:isocitrate dehydrogenase